MNSDELTKAKFQACMRNTASRYGTFELYSNKKIHDYLFQNFNRIMIKCDLDEYSELLFDYFIEILEINQLNQDVMNYYNMSSEEIVKYRLELLKTFRFLNNNSNDLIKSFTISKSRNKHIVRNEKLIYDLESFLIKNFSNNFKEMLSDEDADQELQNSKNKTWLAQWLNEYEIQGFGNTNPNYTDIEDSKTYLVALTNEHLSGIELKKNIIRSFKLTHPKTTELTSDNIDILINQYEEQIKGKLGAPPKVLAMSLYAREIVDLIRINQFLRDPNLDSIDNIPFNNENLIVVYKILDFWGFIPEREENSSTPKKYLRTTLKQTTQFLPSDYTTKKTERLARLKTQINPFLSK